MKFVGLLNMDGLEELPINGFAELFIGRLDWLPIERLDWLPMLDVKPKLGLATGGEVLDLIGL